MPLVLPKRCPRCAVKVVQKENGYWECPTCGWTDDPALNVMLQTAAITPSAAEAEEVPSNQQA